MAEPEAGEQVVQLEMASIAAALYDVEQALLSDLIASRSAVPLAEALLKLAAGTAACERVVEDHATGARRVGADTLQTVAIVLHSAHQVIIRLIAAVR